MDLGVGSFVFSQGIVSAIQLIKDPAFLLASPVVSKFIRVTRKSLPIIVLGLLRVILVKGTYYPVIYFVMDSFLLHTYWIFVFKEHETKEQETGNGRHWDFFITLALLPIIQVLLHPVLLHFLPIAPFGVVVSLSTNIVSWLFLEDVLNEFPFRSRTRPSTRPSSWSQRLSTFRILRFSDRSILDLSFLPRLSRHSASGALCRHHHSTTFPIFFLSSTKDAHQQAKKQWSSSRWR